MNKKFRSLMQVWFYGEQTKFKIDEFSGTSGK